MARGPGPSLAVHLAAAYALLVAYASLHPLTGWRDTGAPLLDFVTAPWPRYWTAFDLLVNMAGYFPLGLLLTVALRALGPAVALLLALLLGAMLSLGLETAQNYLPSRVPSNLDLTLNAIGALLGALVGVRWGRVFAEGGALARWRARRMVEGRTGNLGMTLVALWLFAQLNPETLLFGVGDLRRLVGLQPPVIYEPPLYFAVELLATASGMVAAGLLAWHTMRAGSAWLLGGLFLLALAVKALAWAVLVEPAAWLAWLTAGSRTGLGVGMLALGVALALPAPLRVAVAALALLALTALVNLAPDNPYGPHQLLPWEQRHFFNFNGLTRLASSLWPFLALAYLVHLVGRPR